MQRSLSGWAGAILCSLVALTLTLGALSAAGTWFASTAHAEDAPAAAEEPAAAAPADQAGQPVRESFLVWLYNSLTLKYVLIFLFLSFVGVALFVMNALAIRRDSIVPTALVQAFEAHLNEKRYQEAYEMAKADDSFLGKVLAAGMAKLSQGYDSAVTAMEEAGAQENTRIEQRLSYVSLIAQIAPMFGLLGTVDGMVQAFDVISHSQVTPKPSELASGIGTALVTTVTGLCIAIPCIAYHHIIKNFVVRRVEEVGTISTELMCRFSGMGAGAKKS